MPFNIADTQNTHYFQHQMKKQLLLVGLTLILAAPTIAQTSLPSETNRKWSHEFDPLIKGQSVKRIVAKNTTATVTPQTLVEAFIQTTDGDAVAAFVTEAGYTAFALDANSVTVTIPAMMIKTLAAREDVVFINASRQLRPTLHNVRPETGVTKVTTGEGLETPFTGKGVIIGVIDGGFEYTHPAFKDRVVRWAQPVGTLTANQPKTDPNDDSGHGSHVANITGGNKVNGSDSYGIATGAELVLASSSLATNNIQNLARNIKQFADSEGKPFVINMSFGALLGPHDGTTAYDKYMNSLSGPGAILVAAMGNNGGQNMHAYREFTNEEKTQYLYFKPGTDNKDKELQSEVYSIHNDDQAHLTIKPIIIYNKKRYEPTAAQISQAGCYFATGIDKNSSHRQFASFSGSTASLAKVVANASSSFYFMWEVSGNKGDGFHAWINTDLTTGEFAKTTSLTGTYQASAGDDLFNVGEGAASIPSAIAVASYNASDRFMGITASNSTPKEYSYAGFVGAPGAMSNFSSNGPWLAAAPKPTIAAPGGVILSALSKNSKRFDPNGIFTSIINSGGQKYYYGCMNGTSMATPATTGIIALWLEACPTLTYDQIVDIFKKTGRKDQFTGVADNEGWNYRSGYGKIDAYEGLKEVLKLHQSGISETLNSETPITIQKNMDVWKVLFNNNESYADISVYTTGGHLVRQKHIEQPRSGQETLISLTDMQPGVYLIKIQTTAATMTRKVVVK